MTPTLDRFTTAYIEAALWSSTAHGHPGLPEDHDQSFDSLGFGINDLTPDLLEHVIADCLCFQEDNSDLLDQAYALARYDDASAGYDFWLTRNGHGAGFWDRALGAIGRALSDAAKSYGSEDWHVTGNDEDGYRVAA